MLLIVGLLFEFFSNLLERGAEVRIHATVHVRTRLTAGTTVLIGWVAVGDPARILSPEKHEEIWEIQGPLNFPQWVYGVDRDTPDLMVRVTKKLSETLVTHASDVDI
jgi:hypothetical protein